MPPAHVNQVSSSVSVNLTIKMASQNPFSPLFSPRPHILGVGRYLIEDIFSEFIKISPLTHMLVGNITDKENIIPADIQIMDNVETEKMDNGSEASVNSDSCDSTTEKAKENYTMAKEGLTSKHNSQNKSVQEQVHINGSKYPSCVIDRDIEGNEKLVPYKFNEMTRRIFDIFHSLNIPFETEIYKPKEERLCVDPSIFYCKNLFLKDRKGQYFLVICHEDTTMDLKHLRKILKAHRNFNFVVGEEMKFLIGTDPGGVTPLALMFANAMDVSMVISKTLYKEGASLMFHPLDSLLATKISMPSLLRYLKFVGHSVIVVD